MKLDNDSGCKCLGYESKYTWYVNTRGYTLHEQQLIVEWLKENEPKRYGPGPGVWDGF